MIDHTTFDGALSTDILEAVVRVQGADEFPLTAFLLGANKKRITTNERFSWFASSLTARRGQINNGAGAYTSATTNLIVDDASIFTPGDMLLAEPTGEHLFVTGVSVGSSLIAVTRGAGSIAAHADSVANNAYLLNIGNAHGEGAGSPTHKTGNKVELYNLVQTFRQAIEISGRMNRIKTQTEDERTFQRKSAFEQLMRDGEHAMIFGARNSNLTDANGKRVTTMGGLRESVVTHVDNIGGALNKALFISWAESVFSSGSRTKTLFAGPTLLTAIHGLYDGDVRHTTPQTNVGLRIAQIITPHGNLNLVPHNGFVGAYAGDGIAVDIDKLYMRHTQGGELQLKADTQAQGDDATRDEMFAEFGLEYGPEEDHAQIRGVTG